MYSRLLKLVTAIENNSIFSSIKKGFILIIPVLLIGSLSLMVLNLPIDGYRAALEELGGGVLFTILIYLYDTTFGFLSAYIVLSISYYYSFTFESRNYALRIMAMLASFGCFVATFGAATGEMGIGDFGPTSVFTAIICSIVGTRLFFALCELLLKKFNFKTVASDVHYKSSISATIPLALCIAAFIGLNLLIKEVFGGENLNQLISNGIASLFVNTNSGLANGVLYVFILNLLWVFGIHGGNALEQVARDVFVPGNEDPTVIVSTTFIDNFAVIGGCGATICLLFAMFFFAKSKSNRQLAYSSAPTAIFNINEMLVYGFPLVLNPIMLIPFITVPIVSLLIAYAATILGFIPITVDTVTWTTPPFFSGYAATGTVNGIIVQAIIIVVGMFIYTPFLRLSERMQQSREKQLLEKMEETYKVSLSTGDHYNILDKQDDVSALAKSMLMQLRTDVAGSKIKLFYQPQVDADKGVIGAEALLRWSYAGERIFPPLIIKLAVEDGFFNELTHCILRRACKDIQVLRQKTKRTIKISVNITVDQLNNPDFVEMVVDMVKKYGVTGNLVLEVTEETSIIYFDHISQNIDRLHENGIGIAVDDFSMGQTSLKYLQSNHFDHVKLDGSLVRQITENLRSRDIIHSIIRLGKRLGFDIIAEYVENEEIKEALLALGCKLYQGYLYSPAVPVEEYAQFYKDFNSKYIPPAE